MNEKEPSDQAWKYCPRCGTKIPQTEKKIRYCVACGLDFEILPYTIEKPEMFIQEIKLGDNDLSKTVGLAPWTPKASIIWPILSIFIMAGVAIIPFFFIFPFVADLDSLMGLMEQPIFIVILSASEFVFLIVPLLYVGQFLKQPNLSNRFKILGLYLKQPKTIFVLKEILLGIGFAIIGVFLVNLISLLLESVFSMVLIFPIGFTAQAPSVDIESIISSATILEIILFSIIMIGIIGLSEEIAFRGFMQKGLVASYGKQIGIWATAIIFALIHVLTFLLTSSLLSIIVSFLSYFPPYLFLSLLLGYLFYWREENLIAPIIAHGVYDALTFILVYVIYKAPPFLFLLLTVSGVLLILTLASFSFLSSYQ